MFMYRIICGNKVGKEDSADFLSLQLQLLHFVMYSISCNLFHSQVDFHFYSIFIWLLAVGCVKLDVLKGQTVQAETFDLLSQPSCSIRKLSCSFFLFCVGVCVYRASMLARRDCHCQRFDWIELISVCRLGRHSLSR